MEIPSLNSCSPLLAATVARYGHPANFFYTTCARRTRSTCARTSTSTCARGIKKFAGWP